MCRTRWQRYATLGTLIVAVGIHQSFVPRYVVSQPTDQISCTSIVITSAPTTEASIEITPTYRIPSRSTKIDYIETIIKHSPTAVPTAVPTVVPTAVPTKAVKNSESSTILLFEKIVEAEVLPSWNLNGYFLIAQTVVNQLNSGTKGSTLYQVLTHKNNYSVYSSGRYKKFTPSANAREAVRLALSNTLPPEFHQLQIGEADLYKITAFCTASHLNKHPTGTHGRMTKVVQYQNVWFFK